MSKQKHLSRMASPRTWPVKRKGIKWIVKPVPGPHNLINAMPLKVILTEILGIATTTKEVKSILNKKEVLVNGTAKTDFRFPVGLLDVISIPKLKKHYRIIMSQNGKLKIINISDKEANTLLLRIRNKQTIAKGKTQLNFSNGWNLLVNKDTYDTNDVLVYSLKDKKLSNHLKLEKGNAVYFIGGKHAGRSATLEALKETGKLRKQKIAIVKSGKENWETLIQNLLVVGKAKPIITLS